MELDTISSNKALVLGFATLAAISTAMSVVLIAIVWSQNHEWTQLQARLIAATRSEQMLLDQSAKLREGRDDLSRQLALMTRENTDLHKGLPSVLPKPVPKAKSSEQLAQELWQTVQPDLPLSNLDGVFRKQNPGKDVVNFVTSYLKEIKATAESIEKLPGGKAFAKVPAWSEYRERPRDVERQLNLGKWVWSLSLKVVPHEAQNFKAKLAPFATFPIQTPLRSILTKWGGVAATNQLKWRKWLTSEQPTDMVSSMKQMLDRPWDTAQATAANQAYEMLEAAAVIWREKAGSATSNWDTFCQELTIAGNAQPQDSIGRVLNHWVDRFNSRSDYDIKLLTGSGTAGWGTYREFHILVTSPEETHRYPIVVGNWSSATSHDYWPEMRYTAHKIEWAPGDRLECVLYGSRYSLYGGQRKVLLDVPLAGPLALWQLSNAGKVTKNGFTVTIQVVNCPGPP